MKPPITDDMVIRSCGSLFRNLPTVTKEVGVHLAAVGVTDTSGVLNETLRRLDSLKKNGMITEAVDPGLGNIYKLTPNGQRRKVELEAAALAPT